jgi:hypothetical protein
MDSTEIPLWIKVLGLFLAAAGVFLLAAWDMIFDWISDGAKRLIGNNRSK